MNIQIISEILAAEDSDVMLNRNFIDIYGQGLSAEEARFILLHDKNNLSCQFLTALALKYLDEYQKATQLLDKLAVDHTLAMVLRAAMYKKGHGTAHNQPDYAQAILLLDKAIAQNDTQAMVSRADMYRNGHGMAHNQPDYAQAIVLLDKAIAQNDIQAMVSRAAMYRDGHGTADNQPDYAQAIVLLDKAIAQNDTQAMVVRAHMHINGHGTAHNQPDYAQAILLLDKAIAQNNIQAMVSRAYMYRNGHGMASNQPDYAQAILLLDKAIAQNDTHAMVARADMYIDGHGMAHNQPDYAQAILLLDKPIAQNNTKAMFLRAYMYSNGHGTANNQPDYAQAILLLDKAIAQNDTQAMVSRADMYRYGHGTANNQPDYTQAILLLDKAIAQNDAEAMVLRARMYINGLGSALDNCAYSNAMDLIIKILRINPSLLINDIKLLLTSLIRRNYLDAESFLFINLYKPDGYLKHDKVAALDLFQKHPVEHFIAFCQGCIDDLKTQDFTEEAHQFQINSINELMELMPKNKETPVVKAAINRFMAYAALFISQDKSVSYEYFRAIPEEYLSTTDLFDISHLVWLGQADDLHQKIAINLALECSQHVKKKVPDDEGATRLNDLLSKAYLEKNLFSPEKISAQEALRLHAKTQTLNRATQQIMALQKYKSYLLMKDEFEPHKPTAFLSMFDPVNHSKCIHGAVTKLINQLDMGNTLENLLNMPDIENARKVSEGFDQVINNLMELPFLPPQDLQKTSFYYNG